MKLLLEAFACHPDRGSEPGVGWNRAVEAARRHDVWVLTSVENRGAIELARSRGVSSDRLHFLFVDAPFGLRMLSRLRFLHCYWAYFWPWFAWRVARRAHARYVFDLAHRVTYASWRFPSHLHRLGIPFIWGAHGWRGSHTEQHGRRTRDKRPPVGSASSRLFLSGQVRPLDTTRAPEGEPRTGREPIYEAVLTRSFRCRCACPSRRGSGVARGPGIVPA